jgi:two-component system KDP operon response regulator KdpE
MSEERTVLIVDDEERICRFLSAILSQNGYKTQVCYSGESAIDVIASSPPDLVLLDLGLSGMDGFSVIKNIRGGDAAALPIIVISARMHERDIVHALDLGADDYIKKPLRPMELLARCKNALRHAEARNNGAAPLREYRVADLVIDFEQRQAFIGGQSVHLTKNEFRIVALLGANAGKIMPYEQIINQLWGNVLRGGNRILRVNVANIRRKIEKNPAEPEYIFTETGIGYLLRGNE